MSVINFALVVNLKTRRGQASQLCEAANVVANAQRDHAEGRRFLVYRDFHFDQGQFKFVFPLSSFAEMDHPPGQTFRITKEVLGKEGELAAQQFEDAIESVRSDIIRRNHTISNGRGGSEGEPSPYIRHTLVRTQPTFDCMGTGKKVLLAMKKANRHYASYKKVTGSEFNFHIISRLASFGELDEKPTLGSILRDEYGQDEGNELLHQHRKSIIDSTSSLYSYAPAISHL